MPMSSFGYSEKSGRNIAALSTGLMSIRTRTFDFFAVKMELWQIGDSLPAPKFQIVSNPNNWAKIARTNTEQSKLTPTKLYQFELWNKFKEFAQAHNQNLSFTKTYPQHWYNFSIGSSSCHVALTVNTRAKEFGCELYITDNRFGVDRGGGDGRIPSP